MSIKQTITTAAFSTAMNYVSENPKKNLPRFLSFLESFGWEKGQTDIFHKILDDTESMWYNHLMDLWRNGGGIGSALCRSAKSRGRE